MPTATDVDNRPVAIGKWPRLRNSRNGLNQHNRYHHHANNALRQRHGQAVSQNEHRQWCNLENCVHSCDESSNICTDVLLQPELLHELYGIDRSKFFTFLYSDSKDCSFLNMWFLGSSANPLLEFCLDGGGLSRNTWTTLLTSTPTKGQLRPLQIYCNLAFYLTARRVQRCLIPMTVPKADSSPNWACTCVRPAVISTSKIAKDWLLCTTSFKVSF